MSTMHKNVVGPQVRKRRYNLGLKQADLAARLQVLGWEIDRAGVSKIESQLIWVSDFQMLYLGEALKIPPVELLPKLDPAKRLGENIAKLRTKRAPAVAPPHFVPNREPRVPQPTTHRE